MKRPFSERVRYYLEHGRMPFEPCTFKGMTMVLERRIRADIFAARRAAWIAAKEARGHS